MSNPPDVKRLSLADVPPPAELRKRIKENTREQRLLRQLLVVSEQVANESKKKQA